MNMQAIRNIAQGQGIKAGKMTKVTLIREIQKTEGNAQCFATDIEASCEQTQCLWREDCSANSKKMAS